MANKQFGKYPRHRKNPWYVKRQFIGLSALSLSMVRRLRQMGTSLPSWISCVRLRVWNSCARDQTFVSTSSSVMMRNSLRTF